VHRLTGCGVCSDEIDDFNSRKLSILTIDCSDKQRSPNLRGGARNKVTCLLPQAQLQLACTQAQLKVLRALFHVLPSTLSDNVYAFYELSASTDISTEDIDEYGSEEGALNHYLECKLAPRG
jgi:hypothetical protein